MMTAQRQLIHNVKLGDTIPKKEDLKRVRQDKTEKARFKIGLTSITIGLGLMIDYYPEQVLN